MYRVFVPVEARVAIELVGRDDDAFAPRVKPIGLSVSRYGLSGYAVPDSWSRSYAPAMNAEHRCACASDEWRATVRDLIIPWVLSDADLGDEVIELGPGFGATTEVLCERAPHLTAVEIDPELASQLTLRFSGTNVDIVGGDATRLEFADDRFSGAASFSMLHHVPSPTLQDRVFHEACRVLRPGGVFVATDSLDSADLRSFHHDDTYVPIDPSDLVARLTAAGFEDIDVRRNDYAWKVLARCSSTT
jgi:SAM-dependent methyltransferase